MWPKGQPEDSSACRLHLSDSQSSRVDLSRSAFPTTLTDDSAIAAAAMMGESK
ncbi:MAG: hypothetical protein JWO26_2156, partial [Rhodospirillales bacterium]|nr:hypothetical protein [Rhodospirillales bacterium]